MRKGEATRRRIVVRTADLLNTQGYRSTPVSKILRAAGLKKGGLYRHFKSRATLTREAFRYAVVRMRDRLAGAMQGEPTAAGRLAALFGVAGNILHEEAFYGGCPVMNLAVESDHADPKLRHAAREAMSKLIALFEGVVAQGMKEGDFPKGDARALATAIVAGLEGGIALSNLYGDPAPMEAVLHYLRRSVQAADG